MIRHLSSSFRIHTRTIVILSLFIATISLVTCCISQREQTFPSSDGQYKQVGIASFYAQKFQSRKTANGEIFDNKLMTAAHKSLPFGTKVIVRNVRNGKSVQVTINDRGPFIKKRIIDLSRSAFSKIENLNKGLAKVEIIVVE